MIQARVTDGQYDWLVERAIDEYGDMSEAIRNTIDAARVFTDILNARDRERAFREFLARSQEEDARDEVDHEG
jgi:hypothetical protein